MELAERLRAVLDEVCPFEEEDDGALTVHHDDTFASLRVVTIAEGLDMVSLTQILAWDLPLDNEIRDKVAEHAHDTRAGHGVAGRAGGRRWQSRTSRCATTSRPPGLTDDALRTLIMMVLPPAPSAPRVDRRR